jgi:uncharacterized protein
MMIRQMPEQQGITNYIDVKSVDDYSAKVTQLGGQVKMSKTAVPGLGYVYVMYVKNRLAYYHTS